MTPPFFQVNVVALERNICFHCCPTQSAVPTSLPRFHDVLRVRSRKFVTFVREKASFDRSRRYVVQYTHQRATRRLPTVLPAPPLFYWSGVRVLFMSESRSKPVGGTKYSRSMWFSSPETVCIAARNQTFCHCYTKSHGPQFPELRINSSSLQ